MNCREVVIINSNDYWQKYEERLREEKEDEEFTIYHIDEFEEDNETFYEFKE